MTGHERVDPSILAVDAETQDRTYYVRFTNDRYYITVQVPGPGPETAAHLAAHLFDDVLANAEQKEREMERRGEQLPETSGERGPTYVADRVKGLSRDLPAGTGRVDAGVRRGAGP